MTPPNRQEKEQGVILVLALIMMLVMSTMGIGLWYTADREVQQVTATINRSETLYSAETCVEVAARWLETEAAKDPPCKNKGIGTICKRFNGKMDASEWQVSSEDSKQRGKMASHTYECTVTLTESIAVQDQVSAGFDVGQSSGYGGSAPSTKYLYKIESHGLAENNIRSDVEIIASISISNL